MKSSISSGWKSWKALSKRIGKFQARIIFSILYFLIVSPIGFFLKKADYLKLRGKPTWDDYTEMPNSMEDMKQQ